MRKELSSDSDKGLQHFTFCGSLVIKQTHVFLYAIFNYMLYEIDQRGPSHAQKLQTVHVLLQILKNSGPQCTTCLQACSDFWTNILLHLNVSAVLEFLKMW